MSRKNSGSDRRGFVLTMCLAMIVVAGICLAGFARQSLALASEAAKAQEELQRRWSVISCQRALLAQASAVFEAQTAMSDDVRWPLASQITEEFVLGNTHVLVQLNDENAKVNVNSLYRRNPATFMENVNALLNKSEAAGIVVKLPPPLRQATHSPSPVQSWGQTLDWSAVDRDWGQAIARATCDLTCWGTGKVNLRRASDAAVQTICQQAGAPNVAGKILTARASGEYDDLQSLLEALALPTREQGRLRRVLTDQSQCYSLWITVSQRGRTWTMLAINGASQGVEAGHVAFSW